VEVRRTERLTPHIRRITFAGEALEGFATVAPAQHIKVFFAGEGEVEPPIPLVGPDGPVYPEGVARPRSRTYTPRRFDSESLELEVDFFVHGDGPGSSFAASSPTGRRAVIAGPGGGYPVDARASSYVFAGDESAMPAIATLLEALPASATARVLIELADKDDQLPFASAATVNLTWVRRAGRSRPAGDLLTDALRDADWPDGSRFFVACEASAMRAIRRHLLYDRSIESVDLSTRGYWKLGTENHPDHDTGEEE
jgi:NADPH-dependent ferric siderophore reductase